MHQMMLWSTTLTRTQWNRISNGFSLAYLHGHRENGVPLNMKLTEYIMQLQNGTITSK